MAFKRDNKIKSNFTIFRFSIFCFSNTNYIRFLKI